MSQMSQDHQTGESKVVLNDGTLVPVKVAVAVVVATVLWAVSLTGVYYRLEAEITGLKTELAVSASVKHDEQDRRIQGLESDQRTIKQAVCALSRKQQLLVAGCEP